MQELVLFIMTFVIVFIIYKVFIVKQNKRRNSKKRPVEVNYLIYKYNIDIKKVNYKNLLNVISLVSSFDISLIVSLVSLCNSFVLKLTIVIIGIIPLYLISYYFVGKYYVKKGCIKNV